MERVNVNKLGRFLGGWSHLIEDKGDRAAAVRDTLSQDLRDRRIPSVSIQSVNGVSSNWGSTRPYILTTVPNFPKASTIIYVEAYGKDLYVSWKTFQEQTISWLLLQSLFVTPLVLFLIIDSVEKAFSHGILYGLVNLLYLITQIGWIIALIITVFSLYFVIDDFRHKRHDNTAQQWLLASSLLTVFLYLTSVWLGDNFPTEEGGSLAAPLIAIMLSVFFMWFGWNAAKALGVSYLYENPSLFDADDTIAVSLSVHKSLLHALDQVGIDTSQLRLHNETTQGRIGESV